MKKLLALLGLLPAIAFGQVNITNIPKAAVVSSGDYVLGTTGLVTRLLPVSGIAGLAQYGSANLTNWSLWPTSVLSSLTATATNLPIATTTNSGVFDTNTFTLLTAGAPTFGQLGNPTKWRIGLMVFNGNTLSNATDIKGWADALADSTNKLYPLVQSGQFFFQIEPPWSGLTRDVNGNLYGDTTYFPLGMSNLIWYLHTKNIGVQLYDEVQASGIGTSLNVFTSMTNAIRDANTFASWKVDILKLDNQGSTDTGNNIFKAVIASLRTNTWPISINSSINPTTQPELVRITTKMRNNGGGVGDGTTADKVYQIADSYYANDSISLMNGNHAYDIDAILSDQTAYSRATIAFNAVFHAAAPLQTGWANAMTPTMYTNLINPDFQAILCDPLRSTPRMVYSNATTRIIATHLQNGGMGVWVQNRDGTNSQTITITNTTLGLFRSVYDVRDVLAATNSIITDTFTTVVGRTNSSLLRYVEYALEDSPATYRAIMTTNLSLWGTGAVQQLVFDTVLSGTNKISKTGNYLATYRMIITNTTTAGETNMIISHLGGHTVDYTIEPQTRLVHNVDAKLAGIATYAGIQGSQIVKLVKDDVIYVRVAAYMKDAEINCDTNSAYSFQPSFAIQYLGP